MKKFERNLFLSSVDDNYNKKRDIVFAPHCFLGCDKFDPNWKKRSFIDPFPDKKAQLEAQRQIAGLVNWLMVDLTKELNSRHEVTHKIDYWRLIALPWLIELTERAWTSYATFQQIIVEHGAESLNVRVCGNMPRRRFKDTEYFLDGLLRNRDFNWWLDSKIAEAISHPTWKLIPDIKTSDEDDSVLELSGSEPTSQIRLFMRKLKYGIGHTSIIGVRFSGILLSIYTNILPKSPSQMRYGQDMSFDPNSFFPSNFLTVLKHLVHETIPDSLGKEFQKLSLNAQALSYRPGRLRLGTMDLWNDQEKVITATAKEAGEKLVIYQHGGVYGIHEFNVMTYEVEYRNNIFINWGWGDDPGSNGHMLSLPAPHLSKFENRHCKSNDDIIVVGSTIRLRLGRISWQPRTSYLRYVDHTISLLDALDEKVREHVVFRPYLKTTNDIDIGEEVQKQFPETPMLATDLHTALMKCRLLVLGDYSSTLNVAMAANVPTVLYWHNDFMPPRKEAAPYFDALKRCKIMFDDSFAAAEHINQVCHDVDGWWNHADVQEARQAWANRFARTDRFWWWQWIKALAQLRNIG